MHPLQILLTDHGCPGYFSYHDVEILHGFAKSLQVISILGLSCLKFLAWSSYFRRLESGRHATAVAVLPVDVHEDNDDDEGAKTAPGYPSRASTAKVLNDEQTAMIIDSMASSCFADK
jgi:hypothetical protein